MSWSGPRLGELVTAHYGKALKEGDRVSGGPYTVFGSSGAVGGHSKALVEAPTIIIGRKGSVGAVTYAPGGGWPIDTTYYLELTKPDHLDLRYLYWVLSRARLGKRAITTSIPGLNRDELYRTRIPLPPLAEQRRIAAMLDTADAVRRKRRESLRLVDEFLRSAFLGMFGDPVRNEKGWDLRCVKDICTRVTVGHVGPMAKEYRDSGIPLLRSLNVKRGRIASDNLVFVGAEFHSRLTKSRLRPNDVVSVRTGAPGVSAVIPDSLPEANCADLIVMTPGTGLDPHYLSEALNVLLGDRDTIRGSTGAVQTHFNITRAKEVAVPLPPIENQRRFSRLVQRVAQLKAELAEADATAGSLFKSLVRDSLMAR